ncbi:hypothetical protein CLPUN_02970 [Clostridium puniceum]|uniref:Phage protein n=1 Tax=Clostridium puniceum TaxID=29367 RepID=A0A1S8TX44_9CLOT|nr:hypothetical protein [Clostridium puniceum]OOM82328.1 hypothetical protein CLPUN_02970 [Clostridium puniceum]
MAIKKTEESEEVKFTKEQILKSKKYGEQRDLINALLKDGNLYALNDVDEMVEKFMKEGV